jgi:hypothetical protein
VANDISNRRQAVLDVVIHLPCYLANRGPALCVAQARRAAPESFHHGRKPPRENADLVITPGRESDIEAVEIHGGGRPCELLHRPAQPRRDPHGHEDRSGRCEQERRQDPAIDAAAKCLGIPR